MSARAALVALVLAAACRRAPPPPTATATPATYDEGKRALAAGRLDEAERILLGVAARAPAAGEDPATPDDALLALASVRKERGDGRGALGYARQVAAHRPDDVDALAVLAELAHDVGDAPVEIDARERIVQAEPDALGERLRLAGALTAQHELERGKAAFLGYEAARTRLIVTLGKAPDPAARRAAAGALAAAHDGGTARALVLALTDRDATVRAAAVRAVAAVGVDLDPEIRPALRKLQTLEREPAVMAALADALAAPR